MKKVLIILTIFILAFILAGTMACGPIVHVPEPTATICILFDDFKDGDNQTDKTAFGGYWYTYDDLSYQATSSSSCGNSNIWPMSANANQKYGYGATPTFVMSSYNAAPLETPAPGVTSNYYARVSGTVDRSGYTSGFAGFGAACLNNGDPTGTALKLTMNATALGYIRLRFWYKNGPSISATPNATTPWKVKLNTAYSFTGGCQMEDVDDCPVYDFTSTNSWQCFDVALISFAPESWGDHPCKYLSTLNIPRT